MKGVLTVDETCKLYKTGKTKIYSEIKEGRLKARKLGSKTLIGEDSAEEWFQNLPVLNTKNAD